MEIVNRLGLHARAAAKFVRTASAFTSDISVSHQNQTVSGRSIMGLMMLGACKGTTISVSARGSDAPEALQAIRDLVSGRFHEAD
nr:HPr family phosphocarrier protein [Phaeovibrio sulfidiphilus]